MFALYSGFGFQRRDASILSTSILVHARKVHSSHHSLQLNLLCLASLRIMEPISPLALSPIGEDSQYPYQRLPTEGRSDSPSSSLSCDTCLTPIAEELDDADNAMNHVQESVSGMSLRPTIVITGANDEPTPKPKPASGNRPTTHGSNPDLTDSILMLTDQLLTVTKSLYSLADDRFAKDEFDIPRTFCTQIQDIPDSQDRAAGATRTRGDMLYLKNQVVLARNRLELSMSQVVLAENRLKLAQSAMAFAADRVTFAEERLQQAKEKTCDSNRGECMRIDEYPCK